MIDFKSVEKTFNLQAKDFMSSNEDIIPSIMLENEEMSVIKQETKDLTSQRFNLLESKINEISSLLGLAE